MNTIRRVYVYLVCFISLQLLVGAINAMVGGFVQLAVLSDDEDMAFLVLQIAIIIVSGPVFLGHWLWAEYSARQQTDERACLPRRLYLYATLSVLLLYVIVAAFNGLRALLTLIFPPDLPSFAFQPEPREHVATMLNSLVTVLAAGVLWFYHRFVTFTDERATAEASRGGLGAFRYLYMLGFSTVGAGLLAFGLFGFVFVILDTFNDGTLDQLALAVPSIVIGAAAFAPFQFFALTEPNAQTGWRNGLRWLYALGFSLVGLVLAASGLYGLQIWVISALARGAKDSLPTAMALLLSGLPLIVYHELQLHRASEAGLKIFRWLYGLIVSSVGLMLAVIGAIAGWQWVFESLGGARDRLPDPSALFLTGLIVWAYHHFVVLPRSERIGVLHRLYLFGFSGLGLTLTVLGLIGLQEWLYSRFIGQGVSELPLALAFLIAGLPLWLRFWAWAGRQFATGGEEEQKSDLRKAYLYLVIFSAVSAAVVTVALLINGVLRAVLGLPTQGGLGLPIAIIIASLALWAYHAFVLRSDIARVGESKLQAGMQRLYWYVIAGVGLAALTLGLAGDVSVIVRAVGSWSFPGNLRGLFAGSTAAWLAGLPVWLIGWAPAQNRAARADALGLDARRSLLRKAYLYLYWLAAILALLGGAISIVYLGLSALLGLLAAENIADILTNLGQAVGFALIALAVWVYHFFLLRRDNDFARREQQTVAQQAAAEWESLRVVIAAPAGAPFDPETLEQLGRELPHLKPAVVQLPAPEGAAAETEAALTGAHLIISPWALAGPGGPLAHYAAPKLIVLTRAAGVQWLVAGAEGQGLGAQFARSIRQMAHDLKSRSPAPAPTAAHPAAAPETGPAEIAADKTD